VFEWKSVCVPVVLNTVRSCQLQVLLLFCVFHPVVHLLLLNAFQVHSGYTLFSISKCLAATFFDLSKRVAGNSVLCNHFAFGLTLNCVGYSASVCLRIFISRLKSFHVSLSFYFFLQY
jgi:hypothetical protein